MSVLCGQKLLQIRRKHYTLFLVSGDCELNDVGVGVSSMIWVLGRNCCPVKNSKCS